MQRISCGACVGIVLLAVTVACAQVPADSATPPVVVEKQTVVARIGDAEITEAELDESLAGEMFKIRQQLYQLRAEGIKKMVFDRLVEAAAAEQGITIAQYIHQNVTEKIEAPPEEEISKVMAQYRSRLPEDEEKARAQVLQFLNGQQERQQMELLRTQLMAASEVEILLDPPRAEISPQPHNPSRGPAEAPVTLVEFTDFQCPYCSRVQTTLEQVFTRYEGHIRHVFKHLPLPMHKEARMAAEASLCVNDQGKFWQLHDWMFQNQRSISREQILAQIRQQGLDEAVFTECLDQHQHASQVDKDQADAKSIGITGTPAFVINGRIISGAQPAPKFFEVIDDELMRAGVEIPPIPVAAEEEETKPEATTGDTEASEEAQPEATS